MTAADTDRFRFLMNTAYYVAYENIAFSKFDSLCQLQKRNGVEIGVNYQNTHGVRDFIRSISEVSRSTTKTDISNARFVSVLADGSTDRSVVEQESVFVRYVTEGVPNTKFVKIVPVESAAATGVISAINSALATIGLDISSQSKKVVCVNLDGASVNMGCKSGVQALMKKDIPHILPIHCINHNLELAILDTKKGEPYLDKFERTLKEVFKLYYYSPKRRRELQQVACMLDEDLVHFGGIQQIRWVASQERALKALISNYQLTVTHLEDIGATGNGTDSARAKGLLKTIKTDKFVKTLHVMLDIITTVADVSRVFQSESLLLIDVLPLLEAALLRLGVMRSTPGQHVRSLASSKSPFAGMKLTAELDSWHVKMTESASDYMDSRFDRLQTPPLSYFTVLDYRKWPHNKFELAAFGDSEISCLLDHFSDIISEEEKVSIKQQWLPLKLHLNATRSSQPSQVFSELLCAPPPAFKDVLILVELMMALSLSTASVERGFSDMNNIKGTLRTHLHHETLNDLMEVKLNGVSPAEFKADQSLEHWLTSGPGKRHVGGHSISEPSTVVCID